MLEDACMGYIGLRWTCFKHWMMRFDELWCWLGFGTGLMIFMVILSLYDGIDDGFMFLIWFDNNVGGWKCSASIETCFQYFCKNKFVVL